MFDYKMPPHPGWQHYFDELGRCYYVQDGTGMFSTLFGHLQYQMYNAFLTLSVHTLTLTFFLLLPPPK